MSMAEYPTSLGTSDADKITLLGQDLADVLAAADEVPDDDAGFDALALAAVKEARAAKKFVPGIGHPVHKVRDPRTPRLIQIATEEGVRGPHLRLFEAIGRVHPQ